MLRDLRFAARVLMQSKGWTAMVVLSLALGIGANTALFSAVNGLLLRKLPVEDPDSLVRLRVAGRNQMANSTSDYGSVNTQNTRTTFSYPMFQQLRKDNQTMTDLFAGAPLGTLNVVVDGQAEIASAYLASGNYHGLLGVKAIAGRTILPDDDQPGAMPVAAISYAFWNRRFGRDPGVVGKVVQISNLPVTIVGVLPPEFTGVQRAVGVATDMSLPLALDTQLTGQPAGPAGAPSPPRRLSQATYWWLQIMGRLKRGITAEQVEGNLDGVFQETARLGMDSYLASLSAEERARSRNQNLVQVPRLQVSSGARGIYDNSPAELRSVAILSVVAGLILLIVCANVANLLLSRAAARQKELSVRLSMGATRVRLVRQLLTESVLLALVGGALGLIAGYWGKQLLPGQAGQAPLDWRVLVFAFALALFTGILFGIAPAMRATGRDINSALKETSRAVAASRTLLGKSLLVIQVAVSLVLLIGAGLFLATVENLRQVDVGFDPQNLVVFRMNPRLNRYDSARAASLYEQVVERLRAVPGVRAVTMSNPAPMSGSIFATGFIIQGRPYSREQDNGIYRMAVASNFFETMGIPLLVGRNFAVQDDGEKAPKVAIINDAAVRKFFANESPIGRRFGGSPEDSGQMEIVGIVRDARYNSVRDSVPATMYVPYTQSGAGDMSFQIRTAGDPSQAIPAIREAVRQVDPNVPLMGVSTQMEQIEARFSSERLMARAYALFGGLALVVASIGLFGLMSYSVTVRTREIGVRMAIGAERPQVVRMVMLESLILVFIGIAIGLGAAFAAGRFVATLLFGLVPTDTQTMGIAMLVLLLVSAFAGYLPARRASRVDPTVALRYE